MRPYIQFLRGGRTVRLDAAPTLTLLDYLRLHERATGTKEGCAEGDCGACTVVLRRLAGDRVVYQPVNACILLAGQADGSDVITVEDLADGERLHPVQQAMVEHHGSQCGFCTPGFVMSLFGLFHAAPQAPVGRALVDDWIAGNLCRCTGYRPIVDAALAACAGDGADRFAAREAEARTALANLDDRDDVLIGSDDGFFAAPATVGALAALYAAHPEAVIVGGATDVGLWLTKQLRELAKVIWIGRVRELGVIDNDDDAVTFGAGVSLEVARPHLAAIDPDLGELMRRFAGMQVRTAGTIGGNIANGSPIGDTAPALIALGSTLTLQRAGALRSLALEDFFIAYGKQDRGPGEFVRAVRAPKLGPGEHFRCYKVAKRYDQDISAVMGAVKVKLAGRRIAEIRIAFGGMAATPRRAARAEAALRDCDVGEATVIERAVEALAEDFSPIDDMRASAAYRLQVAKALVARAIAEIAGTSSQATRVFGRRQGDATAA